MITAEEVRQGARGRWDQILAALAPQLRRALDRVGRHVPCPVHGGKDGFRVFKDVAATGGSVCNTCGVFPDGFATLMWVNGWDFPTALREVADFLHLGSTSTNHSERARSDNHRHSDDERLRQALNRVWRESIPINDPGAEPARRYLARRGISIRPPETLRFHPSLPYYDGERKVAAFPAIIAMVTGSDGRPVTIHRTYITQDGRKAPVESPKKLMVYPKDRKIVGGAIRLTEPDHVLAVAEGLETTLAVMEGTGLPVWCAVNAHLLENWVPPAWVERVLIFADRDRSTPQHPMGHGQEAAARLRERLNRLGIRAEVYLPPTPVGTDWLDALNEMGARAFVEVTNPSRWRIVA